MPKVYADLEINEDFQWFPEGATFRKLSANHYTLTLNGERVPGKWSIVTNPNREVFTGCKCQ